MARPRGHDSTGGVDVEVNVLVRIFRFQEQQLGNHEVGHVVFDLADQKDHPFLEQAGVNVKGPFAPRRLFDHHRDETGSVWCGLYRLLAVNHDVLS